MSKVIDFLVLPREITRFEAAYLKRLNKIGLAVLAAHVPIFTLVAWANGTGPLYALALTLLVLAGPLFAWLKLENPRSVSTTYAVAAMCMGGLLVHFGQGPMQIEMHFYFFCVIAMLAVFANPAVILTAAGTAAVHHLVVWLVLPKSVFNYQASVWVVALHAGFVVVESVASCFIARSFFDNVIGLEKVVAARTEALDARNQDMRLVLDNVKQGFATIDPAGILSSERSAAFDAWFGPVAEGSTLFAVVAQKSPEFAARSRFAWEQVADGFLPIELSLDQMPRLLSLGEVEWSFEYRPIGGTDAPTGFLVVATDVSEVRLHARADREHREGLTLFERILSDRSGLTSFFEASSQQVKAITGTSLDGDLATYKRALHTLKGNSAIFGLESLAETCHELESCIEQDGLPSLEQRKPLSERWARLSEQMCRLLGSRRDVIEIEPAEHARLEQAIRRGLPKDALLRQFHELKLDATQRRLDSFAEQAKRISDRLEKGKIEVSVEANNLRVDAAHWGEFWSAFVHAVRNAIDHGLEAPAARSAAGKGTCGRIALRTRIDGAQFVVEIEDDGNGIDWGKLSAKAEHLGLTTERREDLLFVDGLSTALCVSDISGRGVGLGALREATRALGGIVEVESTVGLGTTMRMVFPEHAMMPDLYGQESLKRAA
jgi:two-component system, chemotaxis family, sensor kinase CheA